MSKESKKRRDRKKKLEHKRATKWRHGLTIRIRVAQGAIEFSKDEARRRRMLAGMTNWQLTQWNRAKCPPDMKSINHFANLQRIR
jgi:hypothetical protein